MLSRECRLNVHSPVPTPTPTKPCKPYVDNVNNALSLFTMDVSSSRKRPRPVVSCLRCREKKLKCDRAAPCQNCSKAGCRAECAYNQHPPQSSESLLKSKRAHLSTDGDGPDQKTSSRLGTGIIEDLQQRVVKLEELLAVQLQANKYGPMRDVPVQSSWYVSHNHIFLQVLLLTFFRSSRPQTDSTFSTSPCPGTLVVKGSRSRYHGQNSRVALLNQVGCLVYLTLFTFS